ncbi:MAG: hypothetical protein ACK5Q6_03710 [Cyanobacteriota bacterium]
MAWLDGVSRRGAATPFRANGRASCPGSGSWREAADPFEHEGNKRRCLALTRQQRGGLPA